jgi:hypothetical protein
MTFTASSILAVYIVILQIADFITTKHILANGGRELNPFLNRVMKKIGVTPTLVIMKGAIALSVVGWHMNGGTVFVLAAIAIMYSWVIYNNISQY